jgi:pyruvate/2-oxoglutarate/acetoin dehydrogenase E1 component
MAEKLYREAVVDAIDEEMARDERVFLLGEDVGFFGGAFATTKGLFDKYGPKRLMDTPISETAIVGAALGCALTGLRPIAELMFIDFTGVCMDQIANQVAKARYMSGGQVTVPIVIRTQGGAGRSFAAQHSQSKEFLASEKAVIEYCAGPGFSMDGIVNQMDLHEQRASRLWIKSASTK